MKRAFVVLVASLAVVSLARWSASAQGQEEPFDHIFRPAASAPADKAKPVSPEMKLQKMQEELVSLTRARAELMTELELAAAIAAAKIENSRVQAKRDLERAQALLNEIAEKHPETPAGISAMKALRALQLPEPEVDREFTKPDLFDGPYERPASAKAPDRKDEGLFGPAEPFEFPAENKKR